MAFSIPSDSRWRSWVMALALTAVFLAGGLRDVDLASREGVVCEAICRQLIDNTTEGRQALVSSAWWPPLPVLLRLPIAALVRGEAGPLSSLLISALLGMAALFLLNRILKRWGMGRLRWLVTAIPAVNPQFLRECVDGSSGTTVLFLVFLSAYGLVQWVAHRKLSFLIYLALGTALLLATSLEMAPWALLVLLLLVVDQMMMPSRHFYKEAVFILAFFPLLYTVGLWMLMNWLVMGDALYFARSLFTPRSIRDMVPGSPVGITVFHYASAAVSLVLAILALARKNRAGVCLGILGFSPLPFALLMGAKGLLWEPVPVLFCLFPFAVLSTTYLAVVMSAKPSRRSVIPVIAVLLIITGTVDWRYPAGKVAEKRAGSYGPASTDQNRWLPRIERHVLSRSKYATVFVCGYDSFPLIGSHPGVVFVHSLDFNFDKAEKDYPGHDLYVLVHRPQGRSAMDSIHWKYPRIFTLGSRTTLYDADFGDWRLFEIIQAPTDRKSERDPVLRRENAPDGRSR